MSAVPSSFLREIFTVLKDERIISFAGGLPNPSLFPTQAFKRAADAALSEAPQQALQYGATEGVPELREIIAHSYARKDGIDVHPDHILITNGSQQGLDLLGKVLVNEGDRVGVENPTYLAALQALSLYKPSVIEIPLTPEGLDTDALSAAQNAAPLTMLYTIPNFQNPSGLTYSNETRERVVAALNGSHTLLVEDDPYGEIRFIGERRTPFLAYTDEVVMLGSFSKIVAPGLRLGWMVVKDAELYAALHTAKQAADLHTSTLTQHIVYRYYRDNDTDAHVRAIAHAYKQQKDTMLAALKEHLPDDVSYTDPEGGMFIWATFPEAVRTAELFPLAIAEGVAFVPGESFYSTGGVTNTLRLNFTNSSPEQITEGVTRLARAYTRYCA